MAANDKNTMSINPILSDRDIQDQSAKSVNAQDQTLLKALQDLIVRVMDPRQTNDINQLHAGPEAGKLITALQGFISSIVVQSQSRTQNASVEVSFDEEDDGLRRQETDQFDDDARSDGLFPEDPSPQISSIDSGEDSIDVINSVPLEKPESSFEENLLSALRQHVFNKMPIRLLSFEPVGSRFRIALAERGAIYARIASVLKGKADDDEFRPVEMFIGGVEFVESGKEVIDRLISKYTSYAILSHTWLRTAPAEVTYGDWNKGLFKPEDPGYQKLFNFCKAAWNDHRLSFGWMDTVCIKKESSSELDESIRSMYNWYERAAVCITLLAETEIIANVHLDPWFTRGWTLQELLAPNVVKFYNCHWKQLTKSFDNDKWHTGITDQIERATTFSIDELKYIRTAPISRRMQMAATREVTREEDTAYSLMGIFGISISTAYGEGAERAFLRLLQEIVASSWDAVDILNYAGDIPFSGFDNNSAILPTSPKCYLRRSSKEHLVRWRPFEPLSLSHLGLHVPVVLMPGISIRNTDLRCDPIGDYTAIVDILPILPRYRHNNIHGTFNLLDNRISGVDGWKNDREWFQMTFAVFNFTGAGNTTTLPETCIALGLECDEPVGQVPKSGRVDIIRTKEPIVFELCKKDATPLVNDMDDPYQWDIETDELVKHGMQLVSLYL